MTTPTAAIPCCSPATTESVAVVRDKVADARADVLVGQGQIMKTQGDYTSAVLRDVSATGSAVNANVDRVVLASMSQIDKFGLANLNATHSEADKVASQVDRSSYGLSRDVHSGIDKVTGQASTIAWAQEGTEGRRFGEVRAQNERINDAQSAYSDRAFKYAQHQTADSFARLSVQGENGFYRTAAAIGATDKQVLHSEISLGKTLGAGFTDVGATLRDTFARLSAEHCDIKSAIAAAQAAAAECCCEVKQELLRSGKELGLQAAQNYGSIQLEASRNTGTLQLQAAVNHKDSFLEQSKWFALAEKTAMLNKCDLEAKLAACCCEIKETVNKTANDTQTLIQSNETTRMRDALNAATTENAIMKMRREEHHHYYRGGGGHGGGNGNGNGNGNN